MSKKIKANSDLDWISSVLREDDVDLLKQFLKQGKSVNTNHIDGNTLLHLAILRDKVKVFDYLLTVDKLKVDGVNHKGLTPLVLALLCGNEHFSLELIRSGARVNSAKYKDLSPLHMCVSSTVGRVLVEKGADINARNAHWKTPLYLACERGNPDLVHMLLYYGADASIPCCEGVLPFTVALSTCPLDLEETLFEHTFGEKKVPVSLYTLQTAMINNSPLFEKIAGKTSKVVYEVSDLKRLNFCLYRIDPEVFRVFMKRFGGVVKDMFKVCNSLINFVTDSYDSPNFVDFLYLVCDSPFIRDVAERCRLEDSLIRSIITRNMSEDTLTKVICCLLNCGFSIVSDDLNYVYQYYGFCELFKIMLHMEIIDCVSHNEKGDFETFLMPILIYDVNLDIDTCLKNPQKYIFPYSLPILLKFFALSKIREFCLKSFIDAKTVDLIKKLPPVPSLVELSRNTARKYIIQRYQIKTCAQFFTVLNWLPINRFYKAILSYEKELYVF